MSNADTDAEAQAVVQTPVYAEGHCLLSLLTQTEFDKPEVIEHQNNGMQCWDGIGMGPTHASLTTSLGS